MGWIILLVIVGVIGLLLIGIYNRLVGLRQRANQAFADVDVQLKQRQDLIPNLVETVKGYAAHEKGVFEEVTKARAQVQAATSAGGTVEQRAAAAEALDKSLVQVNAVAEAYPELKASQNFLSLQEQLASTEDQLAFARQYYNDSVSTLNTSVSTIPWMWMAGMAGVTKRAFYEAPSGQATPPQVKF